MSQSRKLGFSGLAVLYAAALLADLVSPAGYADQDRDNPSSPPSAQHPLGTDELGRDRLSRLIHGTRVSMLLAPAAAALATGLAAAAGLLAASAVRSFGSILAAAIDVLLSLPMLLLLLAVRALLPLQVTPWASLMVTFGLLGLLGWPSAARIVRASALAARDSTFALQARAAGLRPSRIQAVHVLPQLKPVLGAQFWLLIPAFVLAEANLGILGLGVAEPLPSWGSLLSEMQSLDSLYSQPWRLAPALTLLAAVLCFHLAGSHKEARKP